MKSIIASFLVLVSFSLTAQPINKEITDSKNPFLLGKINKEGLTSPNYKDWFSKYFDNYEPDQTIINTLSEDLKNYEITLFMGTWCGDSKREVPRFYKILEQANFPMDQLSAVALSSASDMYKQSPQHEEKGLNIHRVPTFIFYKNGKEVNRIVEKPVENLEKDIQKILTSKTYKSNYQTVSQLHTAFKISGLKGLKNASKSIIKSDKNELKSMSELNTYAYVLSTSDRPAALMVVLKLNQKLFPDHYRTYQSLGNTYARLGKKRKALKYFKKAQKLEPNNQGLNESIAQLQ